MALLTAAVTVLSLAGTPAQPYGDLTKPVVSDPRTYSGESTTRLGPSGVSLRPYGAFTGRGAAGSDAKAPTTTEIPKVTIGTVSDVDIDTTQLMVPRATLAALVAVSRTSALSLIPRATMGPAFIASSSINKTPTVSAVPKVTLANVVTKPIASGPSLIPVVTLVNAVDKTPVPKASTFTAVPVLTLESTVDSLVQAAVNAQSLVPKATLFTQVLRAAGFAEKSAELSVLPTVSLTDRVRVSGDVDRIKITSRPKGRIRLSIT